LIVSAPVPGAPAPAAANVVGVTHDPALHQPVPQLLHEAPHAIAVSGAHAVPQRFCPVGQWHAPPTQDCPVAHWLPQEPQLLTSLPWTLMHVPPQSMVPEGQTQPPPEQDFPPVHAMAQLPQWVLSVEKSTQIEPGQPLKPALHA
jgi:hypothetical protein